MKASNWCVKAVENVIFNVRWLLNPFYLGLIFVLFLYGYSYIHGIIHLVTTGYNLSTDELKIIVLDTVDVVMVANLVKMIITGSYNSFVSKAHGYVNENISSGMLKIKIATSILVVAAIHLLKEFVNPETNWANMWKQLVIYVAFLATAYVLGKLEFLHIQGEAIEHKTEKDHNEVKASLSH